MTAFKQAHPTHNARTVKKFIRTWVDSFEERGCIYDKHRSGRPPTLTDAEALQASLAFASDRFTTVAEARRKSPYIRRLVQQKGVSEQMLRRRMWQVNPRIIKHIPKLKKRLTDKQKKARVTAAKRLLKMTDEELARVVWMDAKTIWVKPERLKDAVYGIHGFADEKALRLSIANVSTTGVRLKYFSGVNGDKGRVFLVYTSETTELYPKEIREMLRVCDVVSGCWWCCCW